MLLLVVYVKYSIKKYSNHVCVRRFYIYKTQKIIFNNIFENICRPACRYKKPLENIIEEQNRFTKTNQINIQMIYVLLTSLETTALKYSLSVIFDPRILHIIFY